MCSCGVCVCVCNTASRFLCLFYLRNYFENDGRIRSFSLLQSMKSNRKIRVRAVSEKYHHHSPAHQATKLNVYVCKERGRELHAINRGRVYTAYIKYTYSERCVYVYIEYIDFVIVCAVEIWCEIAWSRYIHMRAHTTVSQSTVWRIDKLNLIARAHSYLTNSKTHKRARLSSAFARSPI